MKARPQIPHDPRSRCNEVIDRVSTIVVGKRDAIRQALVCILAHGHLLIEDLPGVGKTTLAHALARTLGLDHRRIQFTSDLLPADVIGTTVYERDTGMFRFRKGAVFAELVLADEINRAPPRTQSALLEAMEEEHVTVEGTTHALPRPFFVIATQNPREQAGTFPLPQSQIDRFLMRISLGYPDHDAERELLSGRDRRERIETLEPVLEPAELLDLQRHVPEVHASAALLDYVQALIRTTRECGRFVSGLSPRAGLALLNAARARALLEQRNHVLPEDVQAVLESVVDHRLDPVDTDHGRVQPGAWLLDTVPVP